METSTRLDWGAELRRARLAAGLPQAAFGHKETIRRWESGRNSPPIGRITEAFERCGMQIVVVGVPGGAHWGETLRIARKSAGLSATQLAVEADVGVGHIWQIENNRRGCRIETYERLIEACGFELDLVLKQGA